MYIIYVYLSKMYTRVHLYGAQRTATREKYSSIALRHLGGELNERDMAVRIVRVLAVLGYTFVYKIQSSHVTSVCVKDSMESEE